MFEKDLEQLVSFDKILWQQMARSVVLVTGSTGLVGSILVRALSAINTHLALDMRIIAHGRNTSKGEVLSGCCGVEFITGDIRNPIIFAPDVQRVDYIFHCAAITQSAYMVTNPVDVIETETAGIKHILNLAVEKHCKSLVYLSSMEVYGQISGEIRETDLGYLNLSNPRSCYPESKRFCECCCAAYARQYNVPAKIGRLALTIGAGIPDEPSNTRVSMQFARNAVAGENIVLHTPGNSVINSVYTTDAILGLLLILLKGDNGEAYNIANPAASASVREIAEVAIKAIGNGKTSVIVNIPEDAAKLGYAADTFLRLNVDKLNALGWRPAHGLADMFTRMVADWREN